MQKLGGFAAGIRLIFLKKHSVKEQLGFSTDPKLPVRAATLLSALHKDSLLPPRR